MQDKESENAQSETSSPRKVPSTPHPFSDKEVLRSGETELERANSLDETTSSSASSASPASVGSSPPLTADAQRLLENSAHNSDSSASSKLGDRLCPRCSGTGICRDCHGSGRIACPVCRGSGKAGSNNQGKAIPCRACKGTKHIACPPKCESCGGKGIITTSFQKEILEKYAPPALSHGHGAKVTKILIIICTALYALEILQPFQFNFLIRPWLYPYDPHSNPWELWRLFTAAFLHGGISHLLCNMYCLYIIGGELEDIIGSKHFLLLFLAGCLGGNIFSVLFNPAGGIGASTGLFAILTGYWALNKRWGLGDTKRSQDYLWSGLAILVIGLALSQTDVGFLDNWGHIGGGLAGLLYVLFQRKPPIR